ncbi:hypothetical protein [Acidovorax sp.]|uniref:hypothetical protein n=1 Tax=Acidovorax sp. TaxID=1872122 RepID=UPI00391A0667
MPNQENSSDGTPHVDRHRPSPDVERHATDGQADARGKGPTEQQGPPPTGSRQDTSAGDGPSRMGLTGAPDANLVAPSGLNERDRGAADVPPTTSEQLNFDDASDDHPRGDNRRTGGTWNTPDHNTGDQGELGRAPGAGLSDRNGPSDPDQEKGRPVA